MPNQNLPKPNIPGQLNTQSPPNTSSPTPGDLASAKTTVFPQPTPGISSRENPAGRPPAKPTLTPEASLSQPTPLSSSSADEKTEAENSSQANENSSASQDFLRPVAMTKPPQPNLPTNNSQPGATPSFTEPSSNGAGVSLDSSQLNKANPSISQTPPSSLSSSKPPAPSAPPAPQSTSSSQAPTAVQGESAVSKDSEKVNKMQKEPGKKSKFSLSKPVLIAIALLLLLSIAYLVFKIFFSQDNSPTPPPSSTSTEQANQAAQPNEPTTIVYWGLWEDGEILSSILSDFEEQEGIRVDYRKQSHRDYRERLEQALESGSGPDVFRFHMTWTSMLSDQLAAMPTSIMSNAEYQQIFYPVSYEKLQLNGRIIGIPLMYDGLALFYNRDVFRSANLSVPNTWSELRSAANQLTVPNNVSTRRDDNITRGGLAIGNASNVEHFSDILALLILQNGGDPANPTSQNVADALTFYTNFIKQDKVWSNNLPSSTIAFARGDVAMMFAPSWRALEIKALDPSLDFGIAPVPQLSSEENIAWASFWAEGVNKSSVKQEAAWKLLKYLSSQPVLREFYNNASLVRPFGEIYPRIDMASELSSDPLLSAYVEDAPFAESFPMASRTHDNGINDQIIQYYADAINAVLAGTQPAKALEEISAGVNQVMQKYSAN